MVKQFEEQIALRRPGEPADVAKIVSFLGNPEGEWINGQSFDANGGF